MPATILAYVTCALVWGTTWYAIRASTGPGGFPTLESVAMRFTLAAVLLAPIVWILRVGPWPRDRRTWIWMVIAGGFDAASYALVYYGEERIPGGLAAVLFSTQPLMLAFLLTAVRFGEGARHRPDRRAGRARRRRRDLRRSLGRVAGAGGGHRHVARRRGVLDQLLVHPQAPRRARPSRW